MNSLRFPQLDVMIRYSHLNTSSLIKFVTLAVTVFFDSCQRTVTSLAKKVHQAQQVVVVRSVAPQSLWHLQQFRPNTVAMVTTAWHLWQWQIDWPQWNIWDDTGRACMHRHTMKTSRHEGQVTESQLHLKKMKNFMDKHDRGWKRGQHWQGVHLQLAHCGMLIRPTMTRHHPLKCHILVRRAGNGELLSGKGWRASFALPAAISFLFPLPREFSLNILLLLLAAPLLCCLLCDEWLHFKLSFFFF